MTKRIYLIMLLVAAVSYASGNCTVAEGVEWKSYGSSSVNDYEYDMQSVTYHAEDVVRVWSKDSVKNEEGRLLLLREREKLGLDTKGYDQYSYTLYFVEMQCSTKESTLIALHDYNKNGIVLFSEEYQHMNWRNIVPGSQADQLYRIVCSGNGRR